MNREGREAVDWGRGGEGFEFDFRRRGWADVEDSPAVSGQRDGMAFLVLVVVFRVVRGCLVTRFVVVVLEWRKGFEFAVVDLSRFDGGIGPSLTIPPSSWSYSCSSLPVRVRVFCCAKVNSMNPRREKSPTDEDTVESCVVVIRLTSGGELA